MPAITSATITAFYLFDVAEQIDLVALRAAIGGGAMHARLHDRNPPPRRTCSTQTPPVVVDGDAFGITDVDGFKLRVKFFDYGVVSLALSRPFAGEWPALVGVSQIYVENAELERAGGTDRAAHLGTLRRGDADGRNDVPERGLSRRGDHRVGHAADR